MKHKLIAGFLILGISWNTFSMVPQKGPQRRKRIDPVIAEQLAMQAQEDKRLTSDRQKRAMISQKAREFHRMLSSAKQLLNWHADQQPNPISILGLKRAYESFGLVTKQEINKKAQAEAFYWLGQSKLRGWGTEQNEDEALRLFELAENQPHDFRYRAKYYLAQLHLIHSEFREALNLLEQAAEQTSELETQAIAKHALIQIYIHETQCMNLKKAGHYLRDIQKAPFFQTDSSQAELHELWTLLIKKIQQQSSTDSASSVKILGADHNREYEADTEADNYD
jgi:hypothetical protein